MIVEAKSLLCQEDDGGLGDTVAGQRGIVGRSPPRVEYSQGPRG